MAVVKAAGRRFSDLLLAGFAATAIAGCAHEPPPPPPQPVAALPLPPPPPPPPPRHRQFPRPAHKPEAPPSPARPEEDSLAMAPSPGGARAPEATPARPGELIGLDQSAAARLFGTAAETSEEPPATVWRWRNATCELDLFFYLDLRSGRMRSLRYTFKGDAEGNAEQQDCLRSLAVARRT